MSRESEVVSRSSFDARRQTPHVFSTSTVVRAMFHAAFGHGRRGQLWWALAFLAAIPLSLPAWRFRAETGYWVNAWSQGTLSPDSPIDAEVITPSISRRQITPVQRKEGFSLSSAIVPLSALQSGGPGKDGIPALTSPQCIPGAFASYLSPLDRVIGVVVQSDARAYPISILTHHEIVNDRVGDVPIAVTYCPLCDSAVVFDRRTSLGEREFGVSGLLYNSNVVMYDRRGRPESLWSQLMTGGISGPGAGQPLRTLPLELTTWRDWLTRYPHTKVLSPETGFERDYSRNPYTRYFSRPQLMFPVRPLSKVLPAKTPVLGIWTQNAARAYVAIAFAGRPPTVKDSVGGRNVTIQFIPAANTLRVVEADEGVSWMYSFWFAWYAFRPHTDIFQPHGGR